MSKGRLAVSEEAGLSGLKGDMVLRLTTAGTGQKGVQVQGEEGEV